MITLSYGFLLPSNPDKGTTLFSALETNIQKTNDHTHDGVNSALIPAQNIGSSTQSLPASNWASYGGPAGHYRQLVSMAAGFTFNANTVSFRSAAGDVLYLGVTKVSNISYYIYSIDNTLDVVAVYGG